MFLLGELKELIKKKEKLQNLKVKRKKRKLIIMNIMKYLRREKTFL
jgi:hypothetical protein